MKPNIVYKEEKRLLWKDLSMLQPGQPEDQAPIAFGLLEQKLEQPHPIYGPAVFQLVVNLQNNTCTRRQLEGLRDLIDEMLSACPEGRIVIPPPNTRIGNPQG